MKNIWLPKCDCFEGTVIRERMCPKSEQELAYSHSRYSEASHGLVSGDGVKSEPAILATPLSRGELGCGSDVGICDAPRC